MKTCRKVAALLCSVAVGIAACDNGPSAVDTRERGDAATGEAALAASLPAAPEAAAATPVRWSANRRSTAEENIQRLYERNGTDFGARSADDYVQQAHTFIASPPPGTETLTRANGDTLYYQASSNTFLVATRDGVPRTMFKPDDGDAYWRAQQDREGSRADG